MDENISVQAAGPVGGQEDGTTKENILIYIEDKLAAIYTLNGGNSITFSIYGNTTNGLELAIESVNVANNIYCLIQKNILMNDFGVAIASDITNQNGIIPGANGYIYKMTDETARYPILIFNTSAIKTLTINDMSNFSASTKLTKVGESAVAKDIIIKITTNVSFSAA